ncbi:hypothetical protein [Chryseobacterium bernardetii]|uniref:hypothetical protein n=1 Tax=Chryseobacterium bernardetii TaxID=1241978 RepID=UPI0016277399|nr:hypothetical protein [Chryseobacterium bernardetii]
MISIAISDVKIIQKKYSKNINKQYEDALQKLGELKSVTTKHEDLVYLDKIINCFTDHKDILTDLPSALDKYKKEIGNVPTVLEDDADVNSVPKKSPIKDEILKALNYKSLRGSFYPKYFRDLGLKTCVYCNSQLAISITTGRKVSAKFQLDHYWPKDVYPWLSICLFNLYPSCGPCNNGKSKKEVEFNFYSDNYEELSTSNFKFGLTKGAKSTYLISKNIEDIKIYFTEPKPKKGKNTFDEVFQIKRIYETQLDIVEELILKSEMYDESYRSLLKQHYSCIGITEVSLDRLILSNYTDIKDIHKRPLSKFMQDIAEEIGLIKS